MSTALPMVCQHCKRPIGGAATYIGTWPYHYECTRGPGAPLTYASMDAAPGARPASPLTEEDVRRIVRDELAAELQKHERALQAATSLIRFGGTQPPNAEVTGLGRKEQR